MSDDAPSARPDSGSESDPGRPEASGELVERARRGDRQAVEELLGRHLGGLRAFVRLRAGPVVRARENCSDLVQSTCREVLDHLDRFQYQGEAGFRQWLYATALRKILNRHEYYTAGKRDAAREIAPPANEQSNTAGEDGYVEHYRTFSTPSRHAIGNEERQRIEAAFDRLPEDYREVVLLSRMLGLSRAEIAQRLGKTEAAVRGLLYRALAQLAEILDEGGRA